MQESLEVQFSSNVNLFHERLLQQNTSTECLWMSFPSVEEGFLSSSMSLDRKSNFGVKSCLEDIPLPLAALSCMVSSHVQPSNHPSAVTAGCLVWIISFLPIVCHLCFHTFPSFLIFLPHCIAGFIWYVIPSTWWHQPSTLTQASGCWLLFQRASAKWLWSQVFMWPHYYSEAEIIQYFSVPGL